MNRITLAITMCIVAVGAIAQEKADIMVSYECKSPGLVSKEVKKNMTLLANASKSKYFNEISLWTDSLNSTPVGKAKLDEIIRANCLVMHPDGYEYWDFTKGPVKNIYTYVFNDISSGSLTVYDEWADELHYYTEPLGEQRWNIVEDSITTVLGYECLMAKSDYHGRNWTAWFAPEIPLSFGPWKFRGLPGLILKAETAGGFSFIATGLERSDRAITPMYSKGEYSKITRIKAQESQEFFENNQESILKAQNGGLAKITYSDENGNEISAPVYDAQKMSLEPDYKKNK
jgi:GLPGLI family protein